MLNKIILATTIAIGLGSVTTASAATFDLSYTLAGGSVLTADIGGTLQADNNTVIVNSVYNATFNGTGAPATSFLQSVSEYFFHNGEPPKLTLDGTFLDLMACGLNDCSISANFVFSNPPPAGLGFSWAFYSGSPTYGGVTEKFNIADYSLTPTPIPSTWLMLLSGFVGLGYFAYRGTKKRSAALAAA
jgi:hypothetical protein